MGARKFHRPSIDLDKTKRVWKNVSVKELKPGDVVSGWGLVLDSKPGKLRPFWLVTTGVVEDPTPHYVTDLHIVFAFAVEGE